MLKECSAEIAQVLACIFNQSIIQAIVRDDWRQAAPIYKNGDKYDPASYMLDSLTCICCKTLEHILVSKIMQHLSEHDILGESPHGFSSGRSCETQLVQFIHDLCENLDGAHNRGHKQTDIIIMDFFKALDKVPHRRLAYKLEVYGIRNEFLQGSRHGYLGKHKKMSSMVFAQILPLCCLIFPQGFVLGPILS